MKTTTISKTEYTLTNKEMQTIKLMALYCRHRLCQHNHAGIHKAIKGNQKDFIMKLADLKYIPNHN